MEITCLCATAQTHPEFIQGTGLWLAMWSYSFNSQQRVHLTSWRSYWLQTSGKKGTAFYQYVSEMAHIDCDQLKDTAECLWNGSHRPCSTEGYCWGFKMPGSLWATNLTNHGSVPHKMTFPVERRGSTSRWNPEFWDVPQEEKADTYLSFTSSLLLLLFFF